MELDATDHGSERRVEPVPDARRAVAREPRLHEDPAVRLPARRLDPNCGRNETPNFKSAVCSNNLHNLTQDFTETGPNHSSGRTMVNDAKFKHPRVRGNPTLGLAAPAAGLCYSATTQVGLV